MQHRLATTEAPNIIQVQLMQVHENHTSRHEQAQLNQGVVHHVHNAAVGGQRSFLTQQHHHGKPYGNEADLAHGGAGQRTLQVNGEQRQHSAQEHGDHGEHQQRIAEGRIAGHQPGADHNQAENAGLGQNAGQQGTGRGRSHRVCLGQPDVQRE